MFWKRPKADPPAEDSLGTLRNRLEEAESQLRRIRVEWEDVLDRLERVMGRINKRAQREEPAEAPPRPVAAPQNSTFEREIAIRRGKVRPGGVGV